ncbi:MAG: hypothetical protein EOP83_09545 [Verrucomicrobiaceae bacterium]|nr:MAG: hypothetical protein EOP83_09545 [Verrucomicrobiaceae bacterium]
MTTLGRFFPSLILLAGASLLTNCGTFGSIPSPEARASIRSGTTTEEQALAILGKPERSESSTTARLHEWAQIKAETGSVKLHTYQVLADSNGVVRKTNDHEGHISKTGSVVTTTGPATGPSQSPDKVLKRGITGRSAENLLGNPLSRELQLDGTLRRTWIGTATNVYGVTNEKPRQYIASFDLSDRFTGLSLK